MPWVPIMVIVGVGGLIGLVAGSAIGTFVRAIGDQEQRGDGHEIVFDQNDGWIVVDPNGETIGSFDDRLSALSFCLERGLQCSRVEPGGAP